MKFDIPKMVEEIVMQAKENQEEFIFETIRPYCENILQIKINKEELKQILLNGIQKQQSYEDCISRVDVKEQMLKYGFNSPDMTVTEFVEDLPSIAPQPKIGKWIKPNIGHWIKMGEGFTPYECSECEAVEFKKSKYCPKCGAEMRGGK